jgi:hypothetical protein
MCPIHHDVIDDDESSYTVERLLEIKRNHEAGSLVDQIISETTAAQLISCIIAPNVSGGSVIYTVNQSGGQVAHSITNYGPLRRSLGSNISKSLSAALLRLPQQHFEIESVNGDSEARSLAFEISAALQEGGWVCDTFASSVFPQPIFGVIVSAKRSRVAIQEVIEQLGRAGLESELKLLPGLERVNILVGTQR